LDVGDGVEGVAVDEREVELGGEVGANGGFAAGNGNGIMGCQSVDGTMFW
jgi:hypothetical protein